MSIEANSGLEYLSKTGAKAKQAVVMLHGYGASMDDLFDLHRFIDPDQKWDWFFPNGALQVPVGPMMTGRAWFPIDVAALEQAMMTGTHRDLSNASPDGLKERIEQLRTFISSVLQGYSQIVIGGFSQGGMLATHLLGHMDERLKGALLFSTNMVDKNLLESSLNDLKHKMSFLQSHGKSDPLLGYSYALILFEQLKLHRMQGEFVSFNGGHEIPLNVIEKSKQFLKRID